MTTEPTPADDRAARVDAIQQRRAATRSVPAADSGEPATETAARRRPARRRHAATGARLLAGSLSAAGALGLMGAMAEAGSPSTEAPGVAATAAPTVIVIRRTAGVTELATPAAPVVTPTAAAPATTSRGS